MKPTIDDNGNTITLKEYINTKLDAIDIATKLAAGFLEKRLDKAERSIDDLLESKAELKGKANQSTASLSLLFSILAMVLAILKFIIK